MEMMRGGHKNDLLLMVPLILEFIIVGLRNWKMTIIGYELKTFGTNKDFLIMGLPVELLDCFREVCMGGLSGQRISDVE